MIWIAVHFIYWNLKLLDPSLKLFNLPIEIVVVIDHDMRGLAENISVYHTLIDFTQCCDAIMFNQQTDCNQERHNDMELGGAKTLSFQNTSVAQNRICSCRVEHFLAFCKIQKSRKLTQP